MIDVQPPIRFLSGDGLTVAYVDRDPGTDAIPLVMLHGGAVDHRMWAQQFDAFTGRRIVAPDARGHGRSSTATGPHRLCDDVVALLDALQIERAVLVGLSMGGSTAVDTALEHPARVAGLVVTGAGTSEPDFSDPWTLDVFAAWQQAQAAGDADGWIEAFMRFVPGPHRDLGEVAPGVVEGVEAMVRDTLATHVVPDEPGTPRPPVPATPVAGTWPRLAGIEAPVLGIVGNLDARDHLRMARTLVESVPRGQLVTIEGCAHYPNMERPGKFNAAVAAFLGSHDL
ncbi:alpha/beta hydrolase [Phytoactinopolyspora alkaliphila]|uniref:Alpha/beta hydrolase n=1 Tax=Phytoactinopolyspora alkaliphila TaxID=1783498 RepID=A0A6N9YTW3_9ACTN|nr:alpha/beta hydrolase [Phytoactinopolyspora alkaliphila]NED98370.1 alpha/beta hydrolase [Phytoactinopolyspora alkaliphila]